MCASIFGATAEPGALGQIEDALSGLWARHAHVPDKIRIGLGIAVGEIAANIIKHATRGLDRPVTMQMSAHVRDNEVQINFTDDGIPAPAHASTPEMPDALSESGRGLALAHAVLNRLTYHRSEDANHWTLVSHSF